MTLGCPPSALLDKLLHAINRTLDLTFEIALNRVLTKELAFTHNTAQSRELDIDILLSDAFKIIGIEFPLNRVLGIADRDLDRILNLALSCSSYHRPDSSLDKYLDFYLDVLTLQQRIARISPAYEGARLLRERKK